MGNIKNKDIKHNNHDISEKVKKCTCQIFNSNSSGFFCKIPLFGESKYLNVLLVNYNSINYNVNEDEYPILRIVTKYNKVLGNISTYQEFSLK